MFWHLLKYYICFVIGVYFKRIKIKNGHFLHIKEPVIIAMNHPNGFMDPVAFSAVIYPPRVRYLARGDAFKKGVVTWLLESLGIIPIFRIQDGGKDGLKKNDETYNIVNNLLKKNKKIIVFAEGICIQERRLRPLKKGVPRMIFGALETGEIKNLKVIPVGINYSNPSQFRSDMFINIGSAMSVNDYMDSYNKAPAKTMNEFIADLTVRMKELIVHIDHKQSEAVIAQIETIYKAEFFKKHNLNSYNLEHDFIFSTKVVEIANRLQESEPAKLDSLFEKTDHYLSQLKKYDLRDWLIHDDKQKRIHYLNILFRVLLIVISFPVYVLGLIGNYIPYKLTHIITKKKVKILEFKASFYMGFGAILFLVFYILQIALVSSLSTQPWWALLIITTSVLCGLACLYLSPFRKKTRGMFSLLKLKRNNPQNFNSITSQRKEIITILNILFEVQ